MPAFRTPLTVSGPYGQYTTEAIVDPDATFTCIPAPALIELGVEPHRVIRVHSRDGSAQFRQLGRALTTVGGQEDIAPVLFGEPGEPSFVGHLTLATLLLQANLETNALEPLVARLPSPSDTGDS